MAVVEPAGNRGDVDSDLLRHGAPRRRVVAQVSLRIRTHRPETTIGLDKEAVIAPGSNLTNAVGHNFHRRKPVDLELA